jgi:hypothetical protein
MLGQSLGVAECLNKAAETRRLHDAEADPDKRLTYLHVEQCWYGLAHCYAFLDRLEALTKSTLLQ